MIGRFDEVLCTKASKVSFQDMYNEFEGLKALVNEVNEQNVKNNKDKSRQILGNIL